MKVLVMAAGAVGGYLAGILNRSGEEVVAVARGANLEAIIQDGLIVESVRSGNFTEPVSAVDRLSGDWQADLIIFCVKSYHNEEAIKVLTPAVQDSTTILTLENGIGSGDQLADAFGSDKILLGAAYVGTKRLRPGVFAELEGEVRLVFGEEDGTHSQKAKEVHKVLSKTGIDVELSSDVLKTLWEKLIYICALSGMTCVTRASFLEINSLSGTHNLVRAVMDEVSQVGRALGVNLAEDVVESTMNYFKSLHFDLLSSMYGDLIIGNPLELNVLNGAIDRLGKDMDIVTPVNSFISEILSVADNRARLTSN